MGERCVQLLISLGEPRRVETLRIWPGSLRMVRAVHEYYDGRSSRYSEIPYPVVLDRHAVDHPKRRVEAECLQNHLSCKLKPRYVAKTQRRISQNGLKLLPNPFKTI